MPEYEDISLEQALAHLRDGTGEVEGFRHECWWRLRKHEDSLQYDDHGFLRLVTPIFAWSFRLVKQPKEPEIVKPVVFDGAWESGRMTVAGMALFSIPFHNQAIYPRCQNVPEATKFSITIRPRAQQERLDALVEAFLAAMGDTGLIDRAEMLARHLRAEKEAK